MLVLSRKIGEQLRIGGDITVKVLRVQGNRIRLGIEAPDGIRVMRGELTSWRDDSVPSDDPCLRT